MRTGAVVIEELVSVELRCFGRSERVRRYQERKWWRVTILEVLRKVWLGMKACECCGRAEVMRVCVLQQRNEE